MKKLLLLLILTFLSLTVGCGGEKGGAEKIAKAKEAGITCSPGMYITGHRIYQNVMCQFKKFSADDLKDEEEDRQSSMVKRGLNYQSWLSSNKVMASGSDVAKMSVLNVWETIYFNYQGVQFCHRNQSPKLRIPLIEDMEEMKAKMKDIDMMMPLQIDSDVLWTRVEDSGPARTLSQSEGTLSDEQFATNFRKFCTTAQLAIRTYRKGFTAEAVREQKRKRSKKDF